MRAVRIRTQVKDALCAGMPELAPLLASKGPAKVRHRVPGFASLAKVVCEQAVSQASADAIWRRLEEAAGGDVRPEKAQGLGEDGLRGVGLSRAKARTILALAEAARSRDLDLDGLSEAPDQEVRDRLMAFPGIGRWTADIYLLLVLQREDVWPAHDLALREAVRVALDLETRPTVTETDALGEKLRPYRSFATLALWDLYLSRRTQSASATPGG